MSGARNVKLAPSRDNEYEESIRFHLAYSIGKTWDSATPADLYQAVALALREEVLDAMFATEERIQAARTKRLYYLSMEFLVGRSLGNNLLNLGVRTEFTQVLHQLGVDLEDLFERERDAALGNGGLGRLAACFLDSMATLGLPGFGYGINYEFGLFKQRFRQGYQHEMPDNWSRGSNPWLIERVDESHIVPAYGRVEEQEDRDGARCSMWLDWQALIGTPHDMPVVGYGGETVTWLRLFTAHASDEFDMQVFNSGDYLRAVEQKIASENISKVLYPSDASEAGRELRLLQEYFLVACALRDVQRRFTEQCDDYDKLPQFAAIQLNDTHPALAVPELMRVLVDEKSLPWTAAWDVTKATIGYTNHTLLPEALETWPVALLERVLPRHLQIIYEINRRFLEEVEVRWPEDGERRGRMSLIAEEHDKRVRMANLAIVGSHSVNGVAALHSQLIRDELVPDFYEMYPERFNNKTNGVTPRRWLLKANPDLSELITTTIGDGWVTDLSALEKLEPLADDVAFGKKFMRAKKTNKQRLMDCVKREIGLTLDPNSLFDVQVKRMHEYKRQYLFAMYMIHEYLNVLDGQVLEPPRSFLVAGKAAPGYQRAKLIIKLLNNVAAVVNQDAKASNHMKVAVLPDYRVSLAERIIPAADLSEQISTAGMEASGTGNMKLAMNGALTMGTLDGANIEICQRVGEENIFIFGLKADEVAALRRSGDYDANQHYEANPNLKRVLDAIAGDQFSAQESGIFKPLVDSILSGGDPYLIAADFQAYVDAQKRASRKYRSTKEWTRAAILNVARMGYFSSDRTVQEYADEIWGIGRLGG